MSDSTGCTRARRCAKSWCSDVTPFEYMQAMAEMWGRAGKDFAAAQQSMFSDVAGQMAKAAGQPGADAAPSPLAYPELMQANAAFAKAWSSAAELSATLTRNMQTGETQDRMATELLGKIFDPRGWFSSTVAPGAAVPSPVRPSTDGSPRRPLEIVDRISSPIRRADVPVPCSRRGCAEDARTLA